MLADAEQKIDSNIYFAIKQGKPLWAKYKLYVLLALVLVLVLNYAAVVAYMFVNVIDPVTDAVATGLDASAVALAASVGLVTGLSAPGITMFVQLIVIYLLKTGLRLTFGAPELAIASALNLAVSVPDIWLWNAVFMKQGQKILPGGRYLRPFFAGILPWTVVAPFAIFLLYLVFYLFLSLVL